jgi:hypothetical protein
MSTVNNGPQIVKTSLAFVLDPTVSTGYIKTPKQISNCITWFDADDLSTITTETSTRNVRFWADKSASNLVLTGGGLTLANEPLSVLAGMNGRNTMRFDGADYIYGAFTTSYTEFTIFLVLKGDISANNYQYPFTIWNGTNTNNFHFNVNDPDGSNFARTLWVYWNSSGSPYSILPLTSPNATSDFLQGSPTLLTFSHTNAGSGTNVIYVNGKARSDQSNVGTQTITIGGSGFNLYMGARTTGLAGPYYGDICELIIYSRQLSTTERSQIHNYLSNKWRIPLQQTTLINRDLIFGKLATCQNNNIPVLDKSYRVNPANATGSPLQSNFYFADSVSWMSSVITTTITLEAWVKPNSFTFYGTSGTDLGTIMIANSNFYLSIDGNGKFNTYLIGSGGNVGGSHLPSTTSVTRHAWNHVVVTFDGSYIRWYLNGVLDKTSSVTYALGTLLLTNYLGIGSEGAAGFGRFLDGYVAGCKIYGKALTTTEVSQNYESSKTEFSNLPNIITSGLTAYLDTDIYSSYIGSGTTFNDLTGNGNYFQLTNSPSYVSTEPKNFGLASASSQYFLYYASIGSPTGNTGISLPSANSWTCAFWFRTTTNTTYNPFLSHMGSGPVYCIMGTTGTTLTYYHYNGGFYFKNGTTNILDNIWHQAVFVNTANTMIIYLDGVVEKASFDSTVSGPSNLVNGFGGSWIGTFTGNLSNFMYYNTNLSAAQVLQNYNAQKFRFGK